MKFIAALIVFVVLNSYAFAQGITVFRDANYSGPSLVITSDWDAGPDRSWNDQISSIRIPAGYKIQVFEHSQYGGASKILSGDWTITGNDFNDIISSIRFLENPGLRRNNSARFGERSKICCDKVSPVGTTIESGNRRYFLVLQNDRNLVLYKRGPSGDAPLWATATNNNADRFVMQADGNFVVYNGARAAWASNTNGNPNASLVVQNDGNLVIYSTDGRAVWASNTTQPGEPEVDKSKLCCDQVFAIDATLESGNGVYFLVFQRDRNLVLYKRGSSGNTPLWATATNNNADKFVMQADGNFVGYNGARAVWTSNTSGNRNASLVIQDDGNLVLYSTDGRVVWATNTVQAAQPPVIVAPVVTAPAVVAPAAAVVTNEPCAMPAQSFQAAVNAVDGQSFRDAKMNMAKQAIKNKCLSLDQIRTIAKLFGFEDQTLEFIKYAYDFTNSKDDYYTLGDIFSFNSNVENFTKFLEGK